MIESAADRLALVRDAGEVIAIDGAECVGIYLAPYTPIPFGEHVMESAQPMVFVRDEDLPTGYSSASLLTIRGAAYSVAESEPDGAGITTIRLRRRT